MLQAAINSIEVRNLTRTFSVRGKDKKKLVANDNLSFEVRRGEVFGLLGPNGAGKTTLVSQLLGLLEPDSGQVRVEGIDAIKHPELVKQLVGFLPQSGMPMRFVEVERALHFTGRLRGQSERDAKTQTRELLERLGMEEYSRRYVNRLSGGMLRLTNFAMSLMGRPQVLILDEPTNELDPHKRRMVWDIIGQMNREQGVTCILVTHNVLEAERVIQRVAVMQQGKIVALGTPGELKMSNGNRVRLEFQLREGEEFRTEEQIRLSQLGDIEEPRPGQYRMYLPPARVPEATDLLVNRFGLERLDDFRIAPPSLEDIYLELDELNRNPEKPATGKELVA
jgi:ABC-type multidrug transport system ATPase subunit